MSSGEWMSEEEWKKVEKRYEILKGTTIEDLDIDMSEIENLIKKERTKPQPKPQGKGKQKQVHQDPMEELERFNKTQLKDYDKAHGTNLQKCALLITAGYVKRDKEGTLRITGKRSKVEETYRTNINKALPEHLKTGKVDYDINELLSVQKLVDIWGLKTGKGYSSKTVHVDPEKDVDDDSDDGDGAAAAKPAGEPEEKPEEDSETTEDKTEENDENVDDFESAMSEVEAIDQQILDIAEAILDPNTREQSKQDIERITSTTQTEEQPKTQQVLDLEKRVQELEAQNKEYDALTVDLLQQLNSGVRPSETQGTGTETPPGEQTPEQPQAPPETQQVEEEYEPAAAPAAVQEPTADREAEAEQKLPEHLKHASMTAAIDATLKAAGVVIKPPSITPLDDIESEKKQEVPSKEQEKYGRHEKIPWHGHNVPWDKIINSLDWSVYPKMPEYDYAGWSNYESMWGGTA